MVYGRRDELARTYRKCLLRLGTRVRWTHNPENLTNLKNEGTYCLQGIYREDLKKLPIL